MEPIKKIIFALSFFMVANNYSQTSIDPLQFIFGQWKVEKYYWRQVTKLNEVEVKKIKRSILHIEYNTIFFEGIHFLDSCVFDIKKTKITKLFDTINEEYSWYKEGTKLLMPSIYTGQLPHLYSKLELSQMDRIDIDCVSQLGLLYLTHDTLILNFLGGVTFFLTKIKDKEYRGAGDFSKSFTLPIHTASINLGYDFYNEPDQISIIDEKGNILFVSDNIITKTHQSKKISLNESHKFIVKIKSSKKTSKWKFKID